MEVGSMEVAAASSLAQVLGISVGTVEEASFTEALGLATAQRLGGEDKRPMGLLSA